MAKDGSLGKLVKALGGLDKLANQINHTTEDFGSNARKSLIKIAPHKADELDKEAVSEERDELLGKMGVTMSTASGTQKTSALNDAKRVIRRKANSKVEARGINDLDSDALSSLPDSNGNIAGMEFIEDTTVRKLEKADNLSADQLDKLQELAKKGKTGGVPNGEINKAILAAEALGTPEGREKAEQLREKRRAIRKLKLGR